MITVVIAFVAALIAMLLTIWDCDSKWVKIFLSIAAISTIGMIIVVVIKTMSQYKGMAGCWNWYTRGS